MNDISVYPNPSSDYVNVSIGNKSFQLAIYDITGRHIKSFDLSKSINIIEITDISSFKNGMYLFSFYNDEQKITKKIIKK
jgi:hypothetical protein